MTWYMRHTTPHPGAIIIFSRPAEGRVRERSLQKMKTRPSVSVALQGRGPGAGRRATGGGPPRSLGRTQPGEPPDPDLYITCKTLVQALELDTTQYEKCCGRIVSLPQDRMMSRSRDAPGKCNSPVQQTAGPPRLAICRRVHLAATVFILILCCFFIVGTVEILRT